MILFAVIAVFAAAVGAFARWLKRPIDPLSLALFVLIPIVFLWPGFFAGKTPLPLDHVRAHYPPWNAGPHPLPHNPAFNDVATQFVPWAKAVRMAWKEGALPLWDRWNGCGTPLAANGQSQAFSPFTFLMFTLPLAKAFVLAAAVKIFLALCGSNLWLRELGTSPLAARFGAVAFGLSFAMTSWLLHPATAEICLWPWVFLCAELLADAKVSQRAFASLSILLALWPLCGHLETAALGALFGTLWFGLRAIAGDLRVWALTRIFLAAVVGMGLSAFLLLPELHAVAVSNRLVLAKDPSHLQFVPWVPYRPGWLGGFITSLFPLAFGDAITSPMISGAAGSIIEMGFGHFGVVGWSCALLFLLPGSRRSAKEWILAAIVLFGLFTSMGLPIFRTIIEVMPGIRLLPPLRMLLLVTAAGVPLAAHELDRLARNRPFGHTGPGLIGATLAIAAFGVVVFLALRPKHTALGGASAQAASLYWTLAILIPASAMAVLFSRRLIGISALAGALTALAAIELLHQGMRLFSYSSPGDLYPETPLIRFLRAQPSPFRIVGTADALYPNTNVFALVDNVGTHDPAERRDYVEFLDKAAGYPAFDYFKTITNLNSPALNFLNARFLVTPRGHSPPGTKWSLVYDGADGRAFENSAALPRVFSPREIKVISSASPLAGGSTNAFQVFGKPLGDLLASGAFADKAIIAQRPRVGTAFKPGLNGSARITDFFEETNRIRFSASVPGDQQGAIIVSSTVNDGGWSAADERGNRLEIGLANGPFLAIALPSGDHRIRLTYLPPGFRAGAAISAATLVVLLGIVLAAGRHIRQQPVSAV